MSTDSEMLLFWDSNMAQLYLERNINGLLFVFVFKLQLLNLATIMLPFLHHQQINWKNEV